MVPCKILVDQSAQQYLKYLLINNIFNCCIAYIIQLTRRYSSLTMDILLYYYKLIRDEDLRYHLKFTSEINCLIFISIYFNPRKIVYIIFYNNYCKHLSVKYVSIKLCFRFQTIYNLGTNNDENYITLQWWFLQMTFFLWKSDDGQELHKHNIYLLILRVLLKCT